MPVSALCFAEMHPLPLHKLKGTTYLTKLQVAENTNQTWHYYKVWHYNVFEYGLPDYLHTVYISIQHF